MSPQPTAPVASPFHANVVPLRPPAPIAATQGTLALELQPRLEPPQPAARPTPPPAAATDLRRRRSVDRWAHRFAQAAVEIVGGDRPVTQLLRHTSAEVYGDLERRAVLVARAGQHQPGQARVAPVRPRVLSVHSSFTDGGAVESSVHVRYGERSRAVAARFERRRDRHTTDTRWVCTALEFA
ncbi:hypothetical protein GCM10023340_27390 [Nocardioides marinquilinus]|uniref:Tim44-like domain-containing protein n=1 Tax=Nocardioides marinquilinus TaxID=1210400 RepID=A0ABP9PQ60_9ACTN